MPLEKDQITSPDLVGGILQRNGKAYRLVYVDGKPVERAGGYLYNP